MGRPASCRLISRASNALCGHRVDADVDARRSGIRKQSFKQRVTRAVLLSHPALAFHASLVSFVSRSFFLSHTLSRSRLPPQLACDREAGTQVLCQHLGPCVIRLLSERLLPRTLQTERQSRGERSESDDERTKEWIFEPRFAVLISYCSCTLA